MGEPPLVHRPAVGFALQPATVIRERPSKKSRFAWSIDGTLPELEGHTHLPGHTMPTDILATDHISHYSSSRRYWVRRAVPIGWWPVGLLALLALLLLALIAFLYFAPHRVETQVENDVKQQLSQAGFPWVEVEGNGQEVHLRGTPPTAVSESMLVALARGTECDTAFGLQTCPTDVHVDLNAPKKPPAAPAKSVAPAPRHFDFVFSATGDSVELTGEVPSAKVRTELAKEAQSRFSNVKNRLTVAKGVAMPANASARTRGLATLKGLTNGTATYKSGTLSVVGVAGSEAVETSARQLFAKDPGDVQLGEIRIERVTEADRCDQRLASILSKTKLRFQTASSRLHPDNKELLSTLAGVLKDCPGAFVIDGHTDSNGEEASNQKLSLARAKAVRASLVSLGIARDRLSTQGYGESRPAATNDTPQGRAQNRRIEIHVKR